MSPCTLPLEAPVLIDLDAGSEGEAIRAVARLLDEDPGVTDPARFLDAVLERQKINPPLLGSGIALPHARCNSVKEIVFAAARCREPVMFGETPVKLVLLFGVPPDRIAEYLAMTAALARRLRDPRVVEALLKAPDAESFRSELEGA